VPLPAGIQVAIVMSLHKKQKEARFKKIVIFVIRNQCKQIGFHSILKIVIITINYAEPNSELGINKLSINKLTLKVHLKWI